MISIFILLYSYFPYPSFHVKKIGRHRNNKDTKQKKRNYTYETFSDVFLAKYFLSVVVASPHQYSRNRFNCLIKFN